MAARSVPELRFELDVDAPSPALTSSAVGIDKVAHRTPDAEQRVVTVFDTGDERLLRAGIVVAHRITAGVGEWYFSAPGWAPRLPAEQVEPLSLSVDIPETFLAMIRPITRGASLAPVAALERSTREYVLRSKDGSQLCIIADEEVLVRRHATIVERFRQVLVLPGPDLTLQQYAHVADAVRAVGGVQVDEFRTLQQRLGAPATGLTDFPVPQPLRRTATMEELVSAVFAADLRALTVLLLDAGRDKRSHVAPLNAQLESVRRDLRGLAHVLEPSWREQVESLLSGVPFAHVSDATDVALDVVEALVCEVRAPKLGDVASDEAAPLLMERAQQAAAIMADRCGALSVGSPDHEWEAALGAAEMLAISAAVAEPVLGKPLRRIARRLQAITEHLRMCGGDWRMTDSELDQLTPLEAFALGARVERGRAQTQSERTRFVALWPDRLDELRRLLSKAKKS